MNAAQFFSTSLEIHPERLSDIELRGLYSFLQMEYTVCNFLNFLLKQVITKKRKQNFSLKGQFTWLFGDINDWNFFALNRIIASVTFYYHPSFFRRYWIIRSILSRTRLL